MKYAKADLLEKLSTETLNESETVEFKKQWGRLHGKEISAIGNREQGGWLIIGVNDDGCVLGIDTGRIRKQKDEIENHIRQYLDPSSAASFISIENINNKQCIFIEIIDPGSLVSWDSKFYKRVGSQAEEMSPSERKALELKRPGFDFSDLKYNGKINSSLVLDFANLLPKDNGDWTALSAEGVLSKLNIKNKNVSGILFGDFTFRLVHYNETSDVLDQQEKKGLHNLLKDNFIEQIQSWTRTMPITLKPGSLSVTEEKPYPDAVLREILVNAVAHASFENRGGGIKVELYPNRIEISNYCLAEAKAFINKKFSKDSFSHNPFLMKILRTAKLSEELGIGKNKIFRYVIEDGKREPVFEYKETPKNYGVWSVTIYNEQPNKNFLNLFGRFKKMYSDNVDKYKISAALVLWRDKTLNKILTYMDEYHQNLTTEIITENNSPFLVTWEKSQSNKKVFKILLKRWVKSSVGRARIKSIFQVRREHT